MVSAQNKAVKITLVSPALRPTNGSVGHASIGGFRVMRRRTCFCHIQIEGFNKVSSLFDVKPDRRVVSSSAAAPLRRPYSAVAISGPLGLSRLYPPLETAQTAKVTMEIMHVFVWGLFTEFQVRES